MDLHPGGVVHLGNRRYGVWGLRPGLYRDAKGEEQSGTVLVLTPFGDDGYMELSLGPGGLVRLGGEWWRVIDVRALINRGATLEEVDPADAPPDDAPLVRAHAARCERRELHPGEVVSFDGRRYRVGAVRRGLFQMGKETVTVGRVLPMTPFTNEGRIELALGQGGIVRLGTKKWRVAAVREGTDAGATITCVGP